MTNIIYFNYSSYDSNLTLMCSLFKRALTDATFLIALATEPPLPIRRAVSALSVITITSAVEPSTAGTSLKLFC